MRALLAAFGTSVAGHTLLVALAPSPVGFVTLASTAGSAGEVFFDVVEPPITPAEPIVAPDDTREVLLAAAPLRVTRARARGGGIPGPVEAGEAGAQLEATSETSSESTSLAPHVDRPPRGEGSPRPRPAPWVLSPSAVARASVTGDVEVPARSGQALAARVRDDLRAAAGPRHTSRRPTPELERRPDGSHEWHGPAFVARVLPDGTVRFTDRGPIQFDRGLGGPPETLGAGFRFDISERMERRRGNDPHYAERMWFLEETAELRERLVREHQAQTARVGLPRVRAQLTRLWEGRGSAPARRRALFAFWDELADDEMGEAARELVVDFVREQLPAGSAEAFSPEELRRLNGARASRAPFAPY